MTTDELRIILSVNGAQGYVNAMNQVTQATGGFDASAGKLMSTLASLVSAAAIVKFSKQCITAASDLQEVANVINVTFGESAAIVDEWAKTSAASFGLSETSAKRYIGTYGTMATQFGYTREQAASMGVELTKLTGDVASFYNIEDKLASIKLKSIFTGETETLKELGVVMTEVNLNAYAMEKGLGKTLKEMTEHEKVALRYSFVMDKLSHAQGDFSRTSDGWANSIRLLKLNLENLKIEIGNELLPVAGQGLALVNKGLKAISPVLILVAQTVKLYGEAWKNASAQTQKLVKASLAVFAVGVVAPRIIGLISGAVRILTMEIATLSGALSAVAGIAGILLASAAIAQLKKQVDELRSTPVSSETVDNIAALGSSAAVSTDAVDDLAEAMNGLGDATEGLDTFLASFDEVNKVGGNNSLMSNLVNTDDLANILGIADGLGDINGMLDDINRSINNVDVPDISANTFLDPKWWQRKLSSVKQNVGGFLHTFYTGEWKDNWEIGAEEIVTALKGVAPNITKAFVDLGSKIYDIMSPVVDAIKLSIQGWTTYIEYAIEKIKELANIYENSSIFKFFSGAGSNLYDLRHENDTEKDDTFTYTSKSGIKSEVLKYNPDGSETELYKKYKSMYNEDGSETELYRRMQVPDLPRAKSNETELYKKMQVPELPKTTSKTAVDNSETEYKKYKSKLVDDAESDLKKRIQNYTINQPNIPNIAQTTYNSYQQPSSSTVINNNYTIAQQPEKQEKETIVEFSPTIQLDGRTISAVVINDINKRTRSSGKSPLIELGG
jgi:hypothetical protein